MELHLQVNLSLQYVFLCCNSSSNSENSSRQLPQIKMSGLPEKNEQISKLISLFSKISQRIGNV